MKSLIFILCLISYEIANCQNDSIIRDFNKRSGVCHLGYIQNFFSYYPSSVDENNIKKYLYLKELEPDSFNIDDYYKLACSYRELRNLNEAQRMFFKIINLDIGTLVGLNTLKYNSCENLMKIYFHQSDYKSALNYTVKAQKYYYNQRTIENTKLEKYHFDNFIALFQEKLGNYNAIIDSFMLNGLENNWEYLVNAIKKRYTQNEIKMELKKAIKLIQFTLDTSPSYGRIKYYIDGEVNDRIDTFFYYSGVASTLVFEKKINIPAPDPLYVDGYTLTKRRMRIIFKNSFFYTNLINTK